MGSVVRRVWGSGGPAAAAAQALANARRAAGGTVYVKGVPEMCAVLRGGADATPEEMGRALYQEALVEKAESMQRTPVLTGALRSTHEVTEPKVENREVSVRITVGGPAAYYAVVVHEDMEAHHTNGQAKFLESTIMESRPYMAARVAKRVNWNRLAPRRKAA